MAKKEETKKKKKITKAGRTIVKSNSMGEKVSVGKHARYNASYKGKTRKKAMEKKRRDDIVEMEDGLSHMQRRDLLSKNRMLSVLDHVRRSRDYKSFVCREGAEEFVAYEELAPMQYCERGCGAMHFENEETSRVCCVDGKGSFENLTPIPDWMRHELVMNKEFRHNIRHYNNVFQMATLGCTYGGHIDAPSSFPFYFKFSGGLYHSLPPLLPEDGIAPRFSQLYVLDNETDAMDAIKSHSANESLDGRLLFRLRDFLMDSNVYAQKFKSVADNYLIPDVLPEVKLTIQNYDGQYSAPTGDEIAVFVPDVYGHYASDPYPYRSILVRNKSGRNFSINELNAFYDPLHYPLMFPHGDVGYDATKYYQHLHSTDRNIEYNTVLRYYQQLIQIRPAASIPLHLYARLYQEYICDQYSKVESWRLNYIRTHQKELKGELYNGVIDFLHSHRNLNSIADVGHQYVILPPSYVGSPRWYRERFLNGMNIINELGSATFIGTMTCNPNWPEIHALLGENETPMERIDIVCRVFNQKKKELINDIFNLHKLGLNIAKILACEFQKRGLPHLHFLCILAESDRPHTTIDFDAIIRADLPDKNREPMLYKRVTTNHLHTCNLQCRDSETGLCHHNFPQSFCEETGYFPNGRVQWKRPEDASAIFINPHFRLSPYRDTAVYDNRDVVPYNPALLLKYDCHVFLDICASKMASMHYLFVYLMKGEDRASLLLSHQSSVAAGIVNEDDEIDLYLNGSYKSSHQCFWRMHQFDIVTMNPSTELLPLHLEDEYSRVTIHPHTTISALHENIATMPRIAKQSKLEAFFTLNQDRLFDSRNRADQLFYHKISKYYVWNSLAGEWNPRQHASPHSILDCDRLNRVCTVPIQDRERYYLRILLRRISDPLSFIDLRSYQSIVYETFQEACAARGFLDDDVEWSHTLKEATQIYHSTVVRYIFAYILAYSFPSEPHILWDTYESEICDDYLLSYQTSTVTSSIQQRALADVDRHLITCGYRLSDYHTMPQLFESSDDLPFSSDSNYDSTFDASMPYEAEFNATLSRANEEQAHFLQSMSNVIDFPNAARTNCFLLHAAAGTGKTTCLNALIARSKFRYQSENSVCVVASTAIATQQFSHFATTAHKRFKLPVHIVDPDSIRCGLALQSNEAQCLKLAKVLIWDEALTIRRHFIEAVDRFFRDLKHNDAEPFGGLIVIISLDSRQTLSKIKGRFSKPLIINSLFSNSYLFSHFRTFSLTTNMRLRNTNLPSNEIDRFEHFLLAVGNGICPTNQKHEIVVPSYLHRSRSLLNMIDFTYGINLTRLTDHEIATRSILTPLNLHADFINKEILSTLPGREVCYFSTDTEESDGGDLLNIPIEILNSFQPSGFPPFCLRLRLNCIVMALRNLTNGIANGTKMRVLELHEHLIKLKILTGPRINEFVVLPRITLIEELMPTGTYLKRKQFPLTLAYALTIDKAQGQSLKRVGLYLPTPCFAHGQLYTAFARSMSPRELTVFLGPNGQANMTRNVVWPEALIKKPHTYHS